jgi:ubiquinone/menaquinone biosynthesis C-methylase UbiE
MVELGRARSSNAGATITWSEADAEQLPFDNGTFDVVASVFGAMFAPRPQLVASEMFRVARPSGLVAMANYSPGGFLGRLSELIASFSAHPAFELPSPFAWGDEEELRRRFAGLASSIEVTHRTLHFESESVDAFLQFWEATNAPQAALRAMQPAETYAKVIAAERQLVEELNELRGRVRLSSPYILAVARNP